MNITDSKSKKRLHDLFYLYLFREEIENKSLMRFGKTKIPQVNSNVIKSAFTYLKTTTEQGRSNYILYNVGKSKLKGCGHFLDFPTVVQEFPEFIYVSCAMSDLATPAVLRDLILPDVPDKRKGVIVSECEEQWLTSHLVVEYSKVSNWVATSNADFAVVVFTMVPSDFPLGKIIEL